MSAPTILAYVPVLHQGYLTFFRSHPTAEIWLLGESAVELYRPLQKDIRRLAPTEIKTALTALGFHHVSVKETTELAQVPIITQLLLPDEDISRLVVEKFLPRHTVTYASTFLRWDSQASLAPHPVTAPTLSLSTLHKTWVETATAEAAQSADWWRQVGAVLVKDGRLITTAHNRHLPHDGEPYFHGDARANFHKGEHLDKTTALHAEAGAIAEAARQGHALEGAEIYVTTFPCPPCAKLIAASGIKKLYFLEGYAMLDGEAVLKDAEVEVVKLDNPS